MLAIVRIQASLVSGLLRVLGSMLTLAYDLKLCFGQVRVR